MHDFVSIRTFILSSTLSKIKNFVLLYRQNPSFLAKTFSISLILGENEKVKLPSHKAFSISLSVAKKWIKSS